MAVTTAAVIGAAAAAKGAVDARKAAKEGNAIARDAANRPAATVDIAALDSQARAIAQRNAAESAALERQYNPGVQELRAGSLESLNAGLGRSGDTQALMNRIMAQAGQPLGTTGYDSALTRQAVEAAAADLALGGQLPQDVRNLVARQALAKAGTVAPGSGLQLGRDIVARDLGLTSLDLRNNRLRNAASIGSQEAALEQGNAAMRLSADQFGRNNLLDSASFLSGLETGEFGRALSAAGLAQNIAAPMAGLDPGSVANLAVGNANAGASAQQQADALRLGAANQSAQAGAQLMGTGLGFVQNYLNRPKAATPTYSWSSPTTYGTTGYTPPATSYSSSMGMFGT
jgi:hypothetical protein